MSQQTLEQRVRQLQEEVLALGGLIEEALIESVDLLRQSDLDTLDQLNDHGRQIHRQRLAIEMGCLSLIATRRPRDGDLHRLVAMVEIAAELEHIGEHARRVARVNYLVVDHQLRRPVAGIQRLARRVQAPLNQALEAFVQGETSLNRMALAETREVNALYEEVYEELLTVMKSKPRIANQAVYLSRAAYNLKRVAERVTGVCEWVVFSITGTMGQVVPLQPRPAGETVVTHDRT